MKPISAFAVPRDNKILQRAPKSVLQSVVKYREAGVLDGDSELRRRDGAALFYRRAR